MSAPERREQLIDAASELVLERSFHDISIDAVAKRSGITRAVVYQHFEDLPDLLAAVVDRAVERAERGAREAEALTTAETEPRDLMLASVRNYIRAVADEPATWQLVLMQPDGAPEPLREKLAEARARLLARMTGAVLPILSDSDDPQLTASALSTIANHYAHLTLADPDLYPPERLEAHADWMIRGFLAGVR